MKDLRQIGTVAIDSGRVAIVDAGHVADELQEHGTILETPGGDGILPVYQFTQDGIEYMAVQLTNPALANFKRQWRDRQQVGSN